VIRNLSRAASQWGDAIEEHSVEAQAIAALATGRAHSEAMRDPLKPNQQLAFYTQMTGDVSGLTGDVDDCELTAADRAAGVGIASLAREGL
jgi:hypothetical protein